MVTFVVRELHVSFTRYALFTTLTSVYAMLGSITAGILADKIGRKYTIVASGFMFLCGAISICFAASYKLVIISWFFTGGEFGIGLLNTPLHIVEISPPSIRGFLISLLEFMKD
ncbi:putative polyol transporter 2 [Mercurialis annua]|uniref:putative polyol transporter 2 n=1 Tax=Mercurialis annua TaxID=3986 RepID=UPI002160FC81|nr:putative polyol transporter 2 [Mercurialis annua]